jgi:hypothetical protein
MDQKKIIEAAAEAAHEANRVYCAAIGDLSQPSWKDANDWQRDSARKGVAGALAGNSPEHPLVELLSLATGDRVRWEWLHHATVPDELRQRETRPEVLEAARELVASPATRWVHVGHYLVARGRGLVVWVEEQDP